MRPAKNNPLPTFSFSTKRFRLPTFGSKNKHPVPIRYSSIEGLPAVLRKAQASAYIHLKGVNISFRAGYTDSPEDDLVSNVLRGLDSAVQKINGKWSSVQVRVPCSTTFGVFKHDLP